jgi:hypothetical protein
LAVEAGEALRVGGRPSPARAEDDEAETLEEGLDKVIELGEIEVELPLSDLYEGMRFEAAAQ